MAYKNPEIAKVAKELKAALEKAEDKTLVLRDPRLKSLYEQLKLLPADKRRDFGAEVNELRKELESIAELSDAGSERVEPIDITAPWDVNVTKKPQFLQSSQGSQHPLMSELRTVLDIFNRMGLTSIESRELDDDFHMFGSLNFPEGHPARDDYDTFLTSEKDKDGKPFVAPAHVSVMQNRLLKDFKGNLEKSEPISAVYTGRTFRNEDVDARHEHTFYQVEIIYVDKSINVGNLLATFKTFLEEYYGQALEIRSQPFYFPFTEPSLELALSCPFCQKKGCSICSQSGWIELLGMGMINPNVLKMAGIDPEVYTGFAGGMGLDRLVMMKHNIEDVRHFESGKLEFLRQFR